MLSDQASSLSPELPVLQDLLYLVLLIAIDHNLWGIGLRPTVLIGLEESHVEDIVDTSQQLPLPSYSEVQVISYQPYLLGNGEWSNEPVMQFPGALQPQVSSA